MALDRTKDIRRRKLLIERESTQDCPWPMSNKFTNLWSRAWLRSYLNGTLKSSLPYYIVLCSIGKNRPFPSCVKILWLDIPEHLSVNLASIQKRALKIVFPDYGYDEALTFSGLESLEKRRISISCRSISAWRLHTRHEVISVPYDLRSGHEALTLESKKRMILLPLNF